MSENEQPKEETALDTLKTKGRETRDRMNEINDLYAFGRPTPEGSEKTPVSPDEARALEAEWEKKNEELIGVCIGIFREQGDVAALKAVDDLLKNIRHHLDGRTSIQHRGDVLARVVVELSKK